MLCEKWIGARRLMDDNVIWRHDLTTLRLKTIKRMKALGKMRDGVLHVLSRSGTEGAGTLYALKGNEKRNARQKRDIGLAFIQASDLIKKKKNVNKEGKKKKTHQSVLGLSLEFVCVYLWCVCVCVFHVKMLNGHFSCHRNTVHDQAAGIHQGAEE